MDDKSEDKTIAGTRKRLSKSKKPESNANAQSANYEWPVSRRDFVKGASVAGASAMLGFPVFAQSANESAAADSFVPVKRLHLTITINGQEKELDIDPRTSLLDLLRDDLSMTGTKKGCDHGQCGACTVLLNGRRINSCLSLAIVHQGEAVTTIEGFAQSGVLNPVQQAFLDHDGYQCGYCTPGQICSAVALLTEAKQETASYVTADLRQSGPVTLSDDEIRERMSGNICRCGAYPGIVAAVRQAARAGKG